MASSPFNQLKESWTSSEFFHKGESHETQAEAAETKPSLMGYVGDGVRYFVSSPGVYTSGLIAGGTMNFQRPQSNKNSLTTNRDGFTLVELLVVIGIIGLLAGLLMPALSGAQRKARQTKCLNHIRQLGLSLVMYADDFDGQFPPRRMPPSNWVSRLQPYYVDKQILKCPNDAWREDRSYIINGWDDYFERNLSRSDFERFSQWRWPYGMKQSAIPNPSETIAFGEKRTGSRHYHVDLTQGTRRNATAGNDVTEVAQDRHQASGGANGKSGGANYAFADGSVRFLHYGQALKPVNLWAVIDEWRNAPPNLP